MNSQFNSHCVLADNTDVKSNGYFLKQTLIPGED